MLLYYIYLEFYKQAYFNLFTLESVSSTSSLSLFICVLVCVCVIYVLKLYLWSAKVINLIGIRGIPQGICRLWKVYCREKFSQNALN